MSIQPDAELSEFWKPQQVFQHSDAQLSFDFTAADSTGPYNLTGCTVSVTIKSSRFDLDSNGRTYTATITDAVNGKATLMIPAADNTEPEVSWYRVDIISGSNRITAVFGPFTVQAV